MAESKKKKTTKAKKSVTKKSKKRNLNCKGDKRGKNKKAMAHHWKPGQSGNPKGRPKGSRARFGEAFVSDFLADWEKHGAKALEETRKNDPAAYVRAAVAILPKQLEVGGRTEDVDKILEQFSASEIENFIKGLIAAGDIKGGSSSRPTPADKIKVGDESDSVH